VRDAEPDPPDRDVDADARATAALRAALDGGSVAADYADDLQVETKAGRTDVVTAADRAAQARVVERLTALYDEPVVGEEAAEGLAAAVPATGPAWIVDPIDGTNNYVRGLPVWTTAVACVVDGRPVAAAVVRPADGSRHVAAARTSRDGTPATTSDRTDPADCVLAPTLWWPPDDRAAFAAALGATVERVADLRRLGSAQATLAAVADGGLDGAFSDLRGEPWDTVAGVHLVRRAGGRVTDLAGEPWRHDATGLVASNGEPAVHEAALAAARAARDARAAEG
jgi:myo-inositol-1(or 4)-monophosphatase